MLKFLRRKKKPRPETAELPADVREIINGLSVVARSSDDEGNPRILVQVSGNVAIAWYHSKSESGRMMKEIFPELNEMQIDRAVLAINSMAKAAMTADHFSKPSSRPKWSASHWEDRRW
jgi:phosphoketolase